MGADNNIPVRKMRALAIEVAIEEMNADTPNACGIFRRRELRTRLHAIIWLGSKEGGRWFRAVGTDHVEALHAIGWARHAVAIMESGTRVTYAQRAHLATGLTYLSRGAPTVGFVPEGLRYRPSPAATYGKRGARKTPVHRPFDQSSDGSRY